MKYRLNPKNGDKLSALGFGCMRFPLDDKAVDQIIGKAIELGVNYFDTAYIYPGNEAALGRALARGGRREKVKVATKLPPYFVKRHEDMSRLLGTQLERLGCGHIDYYLVHMLTRPGEWRRLVELGILDWIDEQKSSGRIVNLGFSFHGGASAFVEIADAYDWDFTMIQYNYLDEHNQAGRGGLVHAAAAGIPVMVMEPLRGGQLARGLPNEALAVFGESGLKRSPADWALRWVLNHPEVLTVLSGMNSVDMVVENAGVAGDASPGTLCAEDIERFDRVRGIIMDKTEVPCTGCGYCMPCPAGIDIPHSFSLLNDRALTGRGQTFLYYVLRTQASAARCTGCGKCSVHCPQGIDVPSEVAKVKKAFEGPLYKVVHPLMNRFMKR